MRSRALRALLNFGLVQLHDGRAWVPKIFRDEFGLNSALEAHEVAGEEE
jgi:predicted transcriptional regulator